MCGFLGRVGPSLSASTWQVLKEGLRQRGPDAAGEVSRAGFAVYHSRLAVRDLHERSNQPIQGDGGQVLAWNGEIYNYGALAAELRGSGLDVTTEGDVLSRGLSERGPEFLKSLRGMYAISWWDGRELTLARDSFGIKPLYYKQHDGGVTFCSRASDLIDRGAISPDVLSGFLHRGSFLDITALGIHEVRPGDWIRFDSAGRQASSGSTVPVDVRDKGESLGELFVDAVAGQLQSDVDVAVLLSGGVDSTAIAQVAANLGAKPICFSLETAQGRGELDRAEETARKFGFPYVGRVWDDVQLSVPLFLRDGDLPSVDGVNVYAVTQAVRSLGLKVALSGAGADELLGGYRRFRLLPVVAVAEALPNALTKAAYRSAPEFLRAGKNWEWLGEGSLRSFFVSSRSLWSVADMNGLGVRPPRRSSCSPAIRFLSGGTGATLASRLATLEIEQYLVPVLLRDGDALAMANSVEIRFPFLNESFASDALRRLPSRPRAGKPHFVAAVGGGRVAEVARFPKTGFEPRMTELVRASRENFVYAGSVLAEAGVLGRGAPARIWHAWETGRLRWPPVWAVTVLGGWLGQSRK